MNTKKEINNFDLIFHLGYPKCASTTLQDIVFPLTKGYSGSGSGKQKNDHYAKEFFALSPSGPSITSSLKQANIWAKKVIEFKQNEFPDVPFSNRKQIGLIAQDVEKLIPELVSENNDGYKTIDYAKLTPLLIESIKSQQESIEKQKLLINELVKRIEKLENN